jgi:hypothetical protein
MKDIFLRRQDYAGKFESKDELIDYLNDKALALRKEVIHFGAAGGAIWKRPSI